MILAEILQDLFKMDEENVPLLHFSRCCGVTEQGTYPLSAQVKLPFDFSWQLLGKIVLYSRAEDTV